MSDSDFQDPRLEFARRLLKKERVAPALAGPRSESNRDTSRPIWTLPRGNEDEVLTMVDVDGVLIALFRPAPGSSLGGTKYRQYIVADDGGGDWGWVQATVDGITRPVTAMMDLEE